MAIPVPIDDLSLEELKKISKDLTIYPRKQTKHKYKISPLTAFNRADIMVDQELKKCVMLPYRYAINNFKDKSIPPKDVEYSSTFKFIKTEDSALRAEQIPVINQSLKELDQYSTSTLNLRTGFGKTICAYFIAAELGEPTLILMGGNTIKIGWHNAGKKHTNAKIDIVKNINMSNAKYSYSIDECKLWLKNKELNPKNGKKIKKNGPTYNSLLIASKNHELIHDDLYGYDINSHILICMKDRYKYVPREWPKFLIIDEADTFCCTTGIDAILWFRPVYILILTATYKREDKLHKILEFIGDTHKIVRELKTDYKVFKFETGFKPIREYDNDESLIWDIYQKSVINNPDRINQILEFITQNVSSHKILVLSSLTPIIDKLKESLLAQNIKCATLMRDQSSYEDSKVLLGTIAKVGRGFDEQNFCEDFSGIRINLLLLTTTFQSSTLYVQTIGRVMRSSNPIVVHMVDDDTTAERHWKKACKFYKKSGATVVDMV